MPPSGSPSDSPKLLCGASRRSQTYVRPLSQKRHHLRQKQRSVVPNCDRSASRPTLPVGSQQSVQSTQPPVHNLLISSCDNMSAFTLPTDPPRDIERTAILRSLDSDRRCTASQRHLRIPHAHTLTSLLAIPYNATRRPMLWPLIPPFSRCTQCGSCSQYPWRRLSTTLTENGRRH